MTDAAPAEKTQDKAARAEEQLGALLSDRMARSTQAAADMSGIQAGVVYGGIIFNATEESLPHLVAWRLTSNEIDEARRQFVEPGGFAEAARILSEHHVVLLYQRGTGRSHAARRLLIDNGASAIAEANPDRELGSVRTTELAAGAGYVWDGSASGSRPLADRSLRHCQRLMQEAGAWLVIVLDRPEQVPEDAARHAVPLRAPAALDVARTRLRFRGLPGDDAPWLKLESDLAVALDDRDPPQKACRAADLAIRVARGEYDVQQALADLREDVGDSVARRFRHLEITERAMSLAVALLENEPYDEVVGTALVLDHAIRLAEVPEGKKLRPRRVFATQKHKLLEETRASVVLREHPTRTGLEEETIRFDRQDWATSVLRYVWREYPDAQGVLRDWICRPEVTRRFSGSARRALCTIVAEVPAHEPLELVRHLARQRSLSPRLLAASVLEQLAVDHNLRPLVNETLQSWIIRGPAYGQWVAAITYGSSFGRDDVPHSLAQLGAIARSQWSTPKEAVVVALFNMLHDRERRGQVLETALRWSHGGHPSARLVALNVGLWVTGFGEQRGFDTQEFVTAFPLQVRTLVGRLLTDVRTAGFAFDRLHLLAEKAEFDEGAASELIRLTTLITADLRWWRRFKEERRLRILHHHRRAQIQQTFHAARRAQRKRERHDKRSARSA